jgi:hypothetical protein
VEEVAGVDGRAGIIVANRFQELLVPDARDRLVGLCVLRKQDAQAAYKQDPEKNPGFEW